MLKLLGVMSGSWSLRRNPHGVVDLTCGILAGNLPAVFSGRLYRRIWPGEGERLNCHITDLSVLVAEGEGFLGFIGFLWKP